MQLLIHTDAVPPESSFAAGQKMSELVKVDLAPLPSRSKIGKCIISVNELHEGKRPVKSPTFNSFS